MNLGKFKKPNYMPKFVEKFINKIEERCSIDLPKVYIEMYIKLIILYFVITVLFIFLLSNFNI